MGRGIGLKVQNKENNGCGGERVHEERTEYRRDVSGRYLSLLAINGTYLSVITPSENSLNEKNVEKKIIINADRIAQ